MRIALLRFAEPEQRLSVRLLHRVICGAVVPKNFFLVGIADRKSKKVAHGLGVFGIAVRIVG